MSANQIRAVLLRSIEANERANRELRKQLEALGPPQERPPTTAALLIGLNYQHTPELRLRGCINDVHSVRDLLIRDLGFREDTVLCATDDKEDLTADRLLELIDQFVERARGCDRVWFHFSGHGSYDWDLSGDERDGRDECLVASDGGLVSDDLLLQRLVLRLPDTCSLVCVADCCHSGTQLDLSYRYVGGSRSVLANRAFPAAEVCPAVCLSGCRDRGTSADAEMEEGRWAGALTAHLVQEVRRAGKAVTCQDLLRRIRNDLREGGFSQVPQITSTRRVKPDTPFFPWAPLEF